MNTPEGAKRRKRKVKGTGAESELHDLANSASIKTFSPDINLDLSTLKFPSGNPEKLVQFQNNLDAFVALYDMVAEKIKVIGATHPEYAHILLQKITEDAGALVTAIKERKGDLRVDETNRAEELTLEESLINAIYNLAAVFIELRTGTVVRIFDRIKQLEILIANSSIEQPPVET